MTIQSIILRTHSVLTIAEAASEEVYRARSDTPQAS